MNLYFFKFPNFFQARVQGSTGTSIFAGSLFLSWPIQRQQFVGETEGALSGSAGLNIMFNNSGGGLIMTSYSNSLASVYNALGRVSQFLCVPSKTTTLVNMTIMDIFSHFWTELPTWPDTLLKTLTNSYICFR